MNDETNTETQNNEQNNVKALDTALQRRVQLDAPLRRGQQSITHIVVRKPNTGTLRGVALTDILRMEIQPLTKVLPRITDPALTEDEIRQMDPADFLQLSEVVCGFLLPKKYQER